MTPEKPIENVKGIAEVKKKGVAGSIGFWFLFTLFLSLLQAWVLVFVKVSGMGNVEVTKMLSDGSIIFFANALTMKAVEEKCGLLFFLVRKRDDRAFDFFSIFFKRMGAGAIVLVTSVALYCMLLLSPHAKVARTAGLGMAEGIELGLLVIALALSLYEAVDNDRERMGDGKK